MLYESEPSQLEITAGNLSDAEDALDKARNRRAINLVVDAAQARVDKFKTRLYKLDPHGVGEVYSTNGGQNGK